MVIRWSQALIHESAHTAAAEWAPGRSQLYVDDPSIVAWGPAETRSVSFAMLTLFWMVLGIPLSWAKGALHVGPSPHTWIGVVFSTPSPGVGRMWLPRPFVKSLLQICRQFLIYNFLPLKLADALVGRAGRVAHVLCHTRPFVSSLYKALSESLRARGCKAREAPPAKVACRRYRHGARWLIRILGFKDRGAPVPNCRDVVARPLPPPDPQIRRMEIDASPTGAGGILFEGGVPTRFFSCEWRPEDFEGRDVHIGSSASQTYFEVLVMVLAVELWGESLLPTLIWGDNTPALQEALGMRGKGLLAELSQVLAVLVTSRSLSLAVGHLPTEANEGADALSRLADPKGSYKCPFPIGRTFSATCRSAPGSCGGGSAALEVTSGWLSSQ